MEDNSLVSSPHLVSDLYAPGFRSNHQSAHEEETMGSLKLGCSMQHAAPKPRNQYVAPTLKVGRRQKPAALALTEERRRLELPKHLLLPVLHQNHQVSYLPQCIHAYVCISRGVNTAGGRSLRASLTRAPITVSQGLQPVHERLLLQMAASGHIVDGKFNFDGCKERRPIVKPPKSRKRTAKHGSVTTLNADEHIHDEPPDSPRNESDLASLSYICGEQSFESSPSQQWEATALDSLVQHLTAFSLNRNMSWQVSALLSLLDQQVLRLRPSPLN